MDTGLTNSDTRKMQDVFAKFPGISQVILYGSRAKGKHKPGSDIDLTLQGQLDLSVMNEIAILLDDLLLPYTFDLSIMAHITDPDMLAHIDRVGVIFYSKDLLTVNVK